MQFHSLSLIILLCLISQSCRDANIPTDQEMIDNFNKHKVVFEEIRQLVATDMPVGHYPLFQYDKDSVQMDLVPLEKRLLLDSLLKTVGIERVYYTEKDFDVRDTIYAKRITFLYYSWGLSITGGAKSYVYAPHLKDVLKSYEEELLADPELGKFTIKKLTDEDLDKVAQRYTTDTELYRALNGDWYIMREWDN